MLGFAKVAADRMVMMNEGRIIEEGLPRCLAPVCGARRQANRRGGLAERKGDFGALTLRRVALTSASLTLPVPIT